MHQEHGLQFRTYVPTLVELLEDADGMVREAAKSTVIELFKYDPIHTLRLTPAHRTIGTRPTLPNPISRSNSKTAGFAPPLNRPSSRSSTLQALPQLRNPMLLTNLHPFDRPSLRACRPMPPAR